MPDIIRDGTGSGSMAKVNSENRLYTQSISISALAHNAATSESSYGAGFSATTCPITGPYIFYMKITDASKNFVVTDMWLSYDGGATNRNKMCQILYYFGGTAPSANNTTSAMVNLNQTSANTAQATVEIWDGASTGMTISDPGTAKFASYIAQGTTHIKLDGGMILGFNDVVTARAVPEEEGKVNLTIMGYFSDTSDLA